MFRQSPRFSVRHAPAWAGGNGAIGNAKWGGIRLRDVLGKIGLKKEAIEVSFDGADGPTSTRTR
jgi:DMSO/TMAO reductase YedYZ molybdopterin-dependent catalytic subunit